MWAQFAKRCWELYDLGVNGTIDEMLLKFGAAVNFDNICLQNRDNTVSNFGFWLIFENHSCYNAIAYRGKERNAPTTNLNAQVVQKLVEPIRENQEETYLVIAILQELNCLNNSIRTNKLLLGQSCLAGSSCLSNYYQTTGNIVTSVLAFSLSKIC